MFKETNSRGVKDKTEKESQKIHQTERIGRNKDIPRRTYKTTRVILKKIY